MARTTRGDGIDESPGGVDGTVASRWRHVGPGIVVAATGVGAGDLVATLLAGSEYGYGLLWAAVIGCVVKISLAEAVGRWHLATGRTLFDGWRALGGWTTGYFAVYVVVWGFVYGATAMSASALPLEALFPGALNLRLWAVLTGLVGALFVWFNHYAAFEKAMTALVGVMFLVVVYVAVRVTPDAGAAFAGLAPGLPRGSLLYTLGLIGGVGGTITMAAYGYWVNAKGWRGPTWMTVMRWDNRVAYVTTGVFVVAMLIVGAELLHSTGVALATGDRGLVGLSDVLADRYGGFTAKLFLIGFFATSFSSLIGVWHGVSLMFADFAEQLRGVGVTGVARAAAMDDTAGGQRTRLAGSSEGAVGVERPAYPVTGAAARRAERSSPFRLYLLWLTFPPIVLLFLDRPFGLVIAYGVLGALFMPFLALTLLWLLNSTRTPGEWRNGALSNVLLTASAVLFLVLCVREVWELPW